MLCQCTALDDFVSQSRLVSIVFGLNVPHRGVDELVLCIPIEVANDLGDGCKHARLRAGIATARGQAPHSRTHIAIHFTHYHTSHFLNHFLPPAVRPHPAVLLRLSSLLARYRVLPAYQ